MESLRTTLQDAANAGDNEATQATLDEPAPLLADVEGGERYAVSETSRDLAATAGEETVTAQQQIADVSPTRVTGWRSRRWPNCSTCCCSVCCWAAF